MYYFEISPDLLGLRSNKLLSISYGAKEVSTEKFKIKINFFVEKEIKIPNKMEKFYLFHGKKDFNKIFYNHPLFLKKYAKLSFEMVNDHEYSIVINNFYWKLKNLTFRAGTFLSPIQHLENVINACLLKNFYSLIYGACVAKDKKSILLLGPPSIGKTETVIEFVKNGYEFLSEDIVISDGRLLYSCPYTHGILIKSFKNLLIDYLDFLFPVHKIIHKNEKTLLDFFHNQTIKLKKKCKINHVFLLERNIKDGVKKMEKPNKLRVLLTLNKANFQWDTDPLIIAFSYFNRTLNLNELISNNNKIIDKICKKEFYIIKANNSKNFFRIINENI
jgi:hypothetical protein